MNRVKKAIFYALSIFLGNEFYARKIGVKVGDNCRIYINRFGSEPFLVELGNNVHITAGVRFITHDGSTCLVKDENGRRYLYRKIVVGNNVFVGMNSIIMPGVAIGDNVIVAAGSVVSKSIPDGYIVGGNPARKIGDFAEYKCRVAASYISDVDINSSLRYRDRVMKMLDKSFKSSL